MKTVTWRLNTDWTCLLHWMHFGGVGVYVTSLASRWSGRGLGEQQEAGVSRNGQSGAQPRGTVAAAGPTSDWNSTAKMSDDEQEQTIAEDLVVTKYKMGGDIANREYIYTSGRWWVDDFICCFRPFVQSVFPTAAAAAMWFTCETHIFYPKWLAS